MVFFIRDIFSLKSKKISLSRKFQILFILLIFISNFTIFNIRKVDLLIYNFLYPISIFPNIINVEIEKVSHKIDLIKNIKEIEYLKNENDKLKNELYEYKNNKNEISEIKKVKKDNFYFLDTINIISIIKNSEKYFIGRYFNASDVNINDLILNQDNFLIGRVISVNKDIKIAKIQLAEDDHFLIPIYSHETKTTGILNNNKKFSSCNLEFASLNKNISLNEGELILTSPEDGLIVSDIKIGYFTKKDNQNCIERNVSLIKDKLFIVRNIFNNQKLD